MMPQVLMPPVELGGSFNKMSDQLPGRKTLAQSFIEQGLINDPSFIKAANLQVQLLEQGSYRLLGSILADIEPTDGQNELPPDFFASLYDLQAS